ncbi:MAG: hypothetical protein DRJ52_07325 [Thermoprotei archaeon]|nr:MAG: hypothetical protein DRJ52_07325 [Thermoprotei archaeon]RLF00865.1 MAG: hypothetical protein DRJ63_01185 [Thermoprotei archaeon]
MRPESEKVLEKSLEETPRGTRVRIVVRCEKPVEKLVVEGGELVYLTPEPTIHGRANAALKKFLLKIGFPEHQVSIVHGTRSRVKVVEIKNAGKEQVLEKLLKSLKEISHNI